MIYLIDNHVVFKRGRETLRGKILAIERYGEQASRPDRRKVVMETTVCDLAGREHHGNVTVRYCDIVGFQELESEVAP